MIKYKKYSVKLNNKKRLADCLKIGKGYKMQKRFLMFYNLTGNKKLALELDNEMVLSDLSVIVTNFINEICEKNKYTFSFYSVEVNGDFKNVPIIPIKAVQNERKLD